MSVEAITWAFGLIRDDPLEKFVLVALANYADPFGLTWVSQATLRERCSCSERKVRSALRALQSEGIIHRVERRRGDGSRASDAVILIGFPGRQIPKRRDEHDMFEKLDFVSWQMMTTSNRHDMPVDKSSNQPAPRAGGGAPRAGGVGHHVPGMNRNYEPSKNHIPPTPLAAGQAESEECNERKRGRNAGRKTANRERTVAGLGASAWAAAAAALDQADGDRRDTG